MADAGGAQRRGKIHPGGGRRPGGALRWKNPPGRPGPARPEAGAAGPGDRRAVPAERRGLRLHRGGGGGAGPLRPPRRPLLPRQSPGPGDGGPGAGNDRHAVPPPRQHAHPFRRRGPAGVPFSSVRPGPPGADPGRARQSPGPEIPAADFYADPGMAERPGAGRPVRGARSEPGPALGHPRPADGPREMRVPGRNRQSIEWSTTTSPSSTATTLPIRTSRRRAPVSAPSPPSAPRLTGTT